MVESDSTFVGFRSIFTSRVAISTGSHMRRHLALHDSHLSVQVPALKQWLGGARWLPNPYACRSVSSRARSQALRGPLRKLHEIFTCRTMKLLSCSPLLVRYKGSIHTSEVLNGAADEQSAFLTIAVDQLAGYSLGFNLV